MNYIELCSGMGGTRIGLNKARWNCLFAADKDPAAVEIYNAVWGHSRCMDISAIISSQLPNYDALVAGFPCQPFSSAGPRFGFDHGEGNVFEHIVRIIADTGPKVILLENVRGLLVHNQGRTFSTVLQSLVQLGYDVIWYLTDLKTLGVPHSRPRIIIVAVDPVHRLDPESVFPWIAKKHSSSVSTIIEQKLPPISKFQKFTTMGKVSGDRLWSADIVPGKYDFDPADLGSIVAPKFQFPEVVHSVRFYARGKGTKPSFRRNGIAHCVGNVPGGAPLFSAPLKYMHQISNRDAFLENANWTQEKEGQLIARLTPESSLRLFGPDTDQLRSPMERSTLTLTQRYRLVANLFSPTCSETAANLVSELIDLDSVGKWLST